MPLVPLARAPKERKTIATPTWDLWWTKLVVAVNDLLTGTQTGMGDPEGIVTAPQGTLWRRTDGGVGTTLYYKSSGGIDPAALTDTGWIAVP